MIQHQEKGGSPKEAGEMEGNTRKARRTKIINVCNRENIMKLLIISHNPISTYQNMGKTMLSLFSRFKKEELCQLYIYPSVSDVDLCESYYRITDKSVIKGMLTRHVKGETTLPNLEWHEKFENEEDRLLYSNPKNIKSYRQLARDIIWKIAPWWNNELKTWIDQMEPDCVFLVPGNNAFIYDVALKISQNYKVPIISYICDDYFFVKKSKQWLEKIRTYFVRKKISETMEKSQAIITICDELNKAYSSFFLKNTVTIMTGSNHNISSDIYSKKKITTMTYMGNLSCNRDNALCDIGIALDEINNSRNTAYRLDVYTHLSEAMKQKFADINSVRLYDFVSGSDFEKVFWNVDLFLHVEDFSEESIDRVKHSVSTKIADILASGIPLFAYGPENIASMAHLKRNECAICVTEKDELH